MLELFADHRAVGSDDASRTLRVIRDLPRREARFDRSVGHTGDTAWFRRSQLTSPPRRTATHETQQSASEAVDSVPD